MVNGCRGALAAFPTDGATDEAALRSGTLSPRAELATRVRLGERKALETTLFYFEDRAGRLDRVEYYQERRLKVRRVCGINWSAAKKNQFTLSALA